MEGEKRGERRWRVLLHWEPLRRRPIRVASSSKVLKEVKKSESEKSFVGTYDDCVIGAVNICKRMSI